MEFGAIADHGSYEVMSDKILEESKRVFKPEFLNRLDDMIVFHQLERNDLVKIVDLEVTKVIERVRDKDVKVQLDRGAVEFLINKGYDPIYVVIRRWRERLPTPPSHFFHVRAFAVVADTQRTETNKRCPSRSLA